MPLVDYASDSNSSASEPDPPKKKPRTASPPRPQPGTKPGATAGPGPGPVTSTSTALPSLPPTFHDLYASTVRTTTRDDPALHQGRTRQIPHVPGNWPSHLYIEWHPPAEAYALLTELVSSLQAQIGAGAAEEVEEGRRITSFLQSDLGAPLPLHISLSRPIVLSSEEKDNFLREVEGAVRGSGIVEFGLEGSGVEWHRTAESARSFLVLRVRSRTQTTTHAGDDGDSGAKSNPNPELTELLRRCNAVVARFGQPGLYEWAGKEGNENGGRVGEAFHVSIAWSFSQLTEELVRVTEQVFGNGEAKRRIQDLRIPVEGVKVKIGNVVTHIALRQSGNRASRKVAKNLLGL